MTQLDVRILRFCVAEEAIRRSRLYALYARARATVQLAIRTSRTAAAADRIASTFSALPMGYRLQCAATAVASAAGVHALLLGLVPLQVRPAVPRAFWIGLAIAAVAAIRLAGRKRADTP